MTKNPRNRQYSIGSRRKDDHKTKIAIIGCGVVGQATGIVLFNNGFDITFVDNNIGVVNELNSKGYKATSTEGLAPQQISIFFVSVPTYVSYDDDIAYIIFFSII